MIKSEFHKYRELYTPVLPGILRHQELDVVTNEVVVEESIKKLFPTLTEKPPLACTFKEGKIEKDKLKYPLRIGCVLSGGQASGGHNVIVGIYEYLK